MSQINHWSESRIEEVISSAWTIAAILCFGFNFNTAGWIFAIKAFTDVLASVYFGYKETRKSQ